MNNYSSTIVVKWDNGNFKAENKEHYISCIKEQFLEEYGISLADNEIQDIVEGDDPTFKRIYTDVYGLKEENKDW